MSDGQRSSTDPHLPGGFSLHALNVEVQRPAASGPAATECPALTFVDSTLDPLTLLDSTLDPFTLSRHEQRKQSVSLCGSGRRLVGLARK